MPLPRRVFFLLVALVGPALAACDDDPAPPPLTTVALPLTTVGACHDPEELDLVETTLWTCAENVDCPCGARCELGRCTFDCRDDSACGGAEVCDPLGACVAAPPPAADDLPSIARPFTVAPTSIMLSAPGAVQALTIAAGASLLPRLEVFGDPAVTIACDLNQVTPGTCACQGGTCVVANLPAGGQRRLWISFGTATTPRPATPHWSVYVASAHRRETVDVGLLRPVATTLPGHYEGLLRLETTGVTGNTWAAALAGRAIPIEADVGALAGGTYPIALRAPSGLLGTDDRLRGTIGCSFGVCGWNLTSTAAVGAVALPSWTQAPTGVTFTGGTLAGALALTLGGAGDGSTRGVLTGRVQLTWRGPAQPIPPAPAVPAAPAATTLSPWEQTIVDHSDPALRQQTMYNATGLGWAAYACAMSHSGQGYTNAQIDAMCNFGQQWLDAWRLHVEALRASPSTAQCEWTSSAPIDYVPCNWDDLMNSACPAFTPYGCVARATAVIDGVATSGCTIAWTPSTSPIVNRPLQCSQRYVCTPTPPANATGDYHLATYELFPSLLANGDLKCAAPSTTAGHSLNTYQPQAFGYFTNADRVPSRTGREMLRACVADLRDVPTPNRTIAQMLQHEGCLDLARATRALGFAGEPARLRATGGPAATTSGARATDAIFLRLIQQWAETHAFVARAGVEETTVASVLRLDPADAFFTEAGNSPVLAELIDLQQRGWATLLHPRVAQALTYVDAATLRAPDYRTKDYDPDRAGEELLVTPLATHQQAVSAPVTWLEAAAAYAELIELDLDRAWRSSDPVVQGEALARGRVAFRQLLAAEALAIGAWRRAVASPPGTAPAWEAQLRIAHRRLAAGLSRALSMSEAIATAGNPLGVSSEDLPVYFFDPVGSVSQYFAMSGFLLGKARPAIDGALAAFQGARTAWDARRTQTWTQLVQSNGDLRRKDDVRERHGRAIQELCGVKGSMAAVNVLSTWMDVNADGVPDVAPDVCHLTGATGCNQTAFTTAALDAMANNSPDDRRLTLCLAAEGFRPWRQLPGTAVGAHHDLLFRLTALSPALTAATVGSAGIAVNATTVTVTVPGWSPASFAIPRAAFYGSTGMVPPDGQARCLETFRLGNAYPLAGRPENPRARAECFQGRLGEHELTVQSQIKAFQESRASFDAHRASYGNAIEGCLRIDETNGIAAAARQRFDDTMSELREAKLEADTASSFLSALTGLLFTPLTSISGVAAFGAGIGALTNGGDSLELAAEMEETRDRHRAFMDTLHDLERSDLCYLAAEQHLVGLDAAAIAIDRAWINVQQGLVALQNARDAVTANVRDARAAIDREDATAMPNLPYEHWLEESIEVFGQKQRHARRVTYLAARAAEFETQSSFVVTDQILRADHPNQLDAAWTAIDNVAGPQEIEGRPDPDVLTFSLCALLGNEDSGGQGPVVGAACNVDDLRRRLTDPANAVFGPTGTYLGQRIRFLLVPFAGAAQVCGERLWSVAAYVRGAAAFQGFVPNVRLELRQRNTFASQTCGGGPMQVASTRPCNNLMLEDPFGPLAGQPMSCGADTFATAIVTADRDSGGPTFFQPDPDYQPASAALAGRGVYGDWELFIPEHVLWRTSRASGLVLEEVEDIVVRLGTNAIAQPH